MDITIIFFFVILIFSVIIHELAHGYVAQSLGDPTAKYAGRLTLNPIPHIDPVGSIILPLLLVIMHSPFFIGWAKPVPINPYNFRDQKWGNLKVAIAGPISNFLIALIFGLLIRFLGLSAGAPFVEFLKMVVQLNLVLALFNLIPIPPLDGHWILFSFLPHGFDRVKVFLQQYGFFILIFLVMFGFLAWLAQLAMLIFSLITGILS